MLITPQRRGIRGESQGNLRLRRVVDDLAHDRRQRPVGAHRDDVHRPLRRHVLQALESLVVGDDPAVVMQTAARLASGRDDSLRTLPAWKAVAERCGTASTATASPIRWFVDPLGLARAVQAANPPREKRYVYGL
mgnify:CR=1 FL=1